MPGKPIILSKLPKKPSNMASKDAKKALVTPEQQEHAKWVADKVKEKGFVVMGVPVSKDQFEKAFYATAQEQYDTAVQNIKAMPSFVEDELMKTMGVTKEGLLKHAEKFNPAKNGTKGKT
jgi:hypothetical protein